MLLLIVGPYSIGYGIWELQVLNEWPFGDDVWPILQTINGGVANIQSDVSGWFSNEVSLFGRSMRRTDWLGWPFVVVNIIIVAGGFIARRRLVGKSTDQSADNDGVAAAA